VPRVLPSAVGAGRSHRRSHQAFNHHNVTVAQWKRNGIFCPWTRGLRHATTGPTHRRRVGRLDALRRRRKAWRSGRPSSGRRGLRGRATCCTSWRAGTRRWREKPNDPVGAAERRSTWASPSSPWGVVIRRNGEHRTPKVASSMTTQGNRRTGFSPDARRAHHHLSSVFGKELGRRARVDPSGGCAQYDRLSNFLNELLPHLKRAS